MRTSRSFAAVTTAAGMGGASLVLAVPDAASAESEDHGRCAGGTHSLEVDREGAGWEATYEIDHVAVGSRWRVTMKHDGQRVARVVRTADREGELELERHRADTKGTDTFRITAHRLGTGTTCHAKVTVR